METTAERKEDGSYILNGSKTWISNSPIAYVGPAGTRLGLTVLLFQGCVRRVGALQVGQPCTRVPPGEDNVWAVSTTYKT